MKRGRCLLLFSNPEYIEVHCKYPIEIKVYLELRTVFINLKS